MRITPATAVGTFIALLVVGEIALGGSTGGVSVNSTYASDLETNPPANGLPQCVSAHTFDTRGWGGFHTLSFEVSVSGSNDVNGKLHLSARPTCTATSFLGAGQATCSASRNGNGIQVAYSVVYPFGLNFIAGEQVSGTFTLSPGGSYSTP